MISLRPVALDTHGVRVADAMEVARRYSGRHTGMLEECTSAWAGDSAAALAQLAAHWEAADARVHARVSELAWAMREGGRHFAAMEADHVQLFAALVPPESGVS